MKLKQIASALMMLGISPLAFADFTIQDIRVEALAAYRAEHRIQLPARQSRRYLQRHTRQCHHQSLYATGFFDDVRVETADGQLLLTVIERPTIGSLNITSAKCCKTTPLRKTSNRSGWRSRNTLIRRHSIRQSLA